MISPDNKNDESYSPDDDHLIFLRDLFLHTSQDNLSAGLIPSRLPRMIYFDPTGGGGVAIFNLFFIDNLISNDLSTTCPNLSTGDKSRQALVVNLNSLFRGLHLINHSHKTGISQWELLSPIDADKISFGSTREGKRGPRIYPTGMASSPTDYQNQFIRNLGKIS